MSNSTSKPVFVNTEMTTALRNAINAGTKAREAKGRFCDLAVAEFGTDAPLHFISPKTKGSLATEESWAAFNDIIFATFTAAEQKILTVPKDSLDDAQKADREYLLEQKGSKQKDIRNAVKRRVAKLEPSEPKAPRPPEPRIRDNAQDIIKVCENLEGDATFRPAEIKALAEQIIRSI